MASGGKALPTFGSRLNSDGQRGDCLRPARRLGGGVEGREDDVSAELLRVLGELIPGRQVGEFDRLVRLQAGAEGAGGQVDVGFHKRLGGGGGAGKLERDRLRSVALEIGPKWEVRRREETDGHIGQLK